MQIRIVISIMMTGEVNVLSINLTFVDLRAKNNDIKDQLRLLPFGLVSGLVFFEPIAQLIGSIFLQYQSIA